MPFRKATWDSDAARTIYIAIVVVSAIVMAVLFVLIVNDRNSLRREANVRATQIQQQRYDATYNACVETNNRHDHTIRQLDKITEDYIKQHPAQAKTIKANIQQNVELIDALVPRRNCKTVAAQAVHPLPAPNRENP